MTTGDSNPNPQYGQPLPGGYPPVGGGTPADIGIRFAARFIDGVIVLIVAVILSIITALLFWGDYGFTVSIFSGIALFIYFVAFEVTQGATLGKKILGLSVRGAGGLPKPTPKEAAIRNSFLLLTIIPFLGGLLTLAAYIYIAVTINNSPTKQGKHDELAGGTQVVKG